MIRGHPVYCVSIYGHNLHPVFLQRKVVFQQYSTAIFSEQLVSLTYLQHSLFRFISIFSVSSLVYVVQNTHITVAYTILIGCNRIN